MGAISAGPDYLARFLASVEDDQCRLLPGQDPPNALETTSKALAEINQSAAEYAKMTGKACKATLTITITVNAAPSNGRGAYPSTHSVKYKTEKPKYPAIEVDSHIDEDGNIVEKEMRQKKLRGVDEDSAVKHKIKAN